SPANNSYYLVGETIDCTAQAYCDECGEISGDIVWSAVEELAEGGQYQFSDGAGPSYSILPPGAGYITINAKITCPHGDDNDSIHETVFEVEITSPVTPPPTANNFVFSQANPGVCDVQCEAEARPDEYTDDIEPWSIDPIVGSKLTTVPSPPKGGIVTFTYTGLPGSNGQFGDKKVIAELTLGGKTDKDNTTVQIFFPRDGTNNPWGPLIPNWYFYWSQTKASSGNHIYDGTTPYFGYYFWGNSVFYIGPPACGNNPETGHDGIDTFAETCIHENTHLTDWWNFWPKGYNSNQDLDGDNVPDDQEPGLGLDPTKFDSNPLDQWPNDFAAYSEPKAYAAEHTWSVGSADSEDWADPGHQSQY
ncbi:MAG: hypothetical protein AB1414_19260, partial [bacterium]